MCLFITAVVSRSGFRPFAEVAAKHGSSFVPCSNPYVEGQLRSTERYVWAAPAHCDCGSPLFSGDRPPSAESIARQVENLRKKKWSEAKIERWLRSTAPTPNDPNAAPNGVRSVKCWADLLDDALRLPKVEYVGLIGHWYRRDVCTEDFEISGRAPHAVGELRTDHLYALELDVIHEFRVHEEGARPAAPSDGADRSI